ncbi:hypothetical protein [Deinococcus sp.]|uniref:hypothetical protein n=1 Tax=Deinococcus sp. TaxID=47478 RepID=UPI0025F9E7D2|nr:hypothetical protein [Deinococcus sp.]
MLYLFCLIVGGGLMALSVFGGHDHDLGADHAGVDHPASDIASFFSLRSLTSFAAFFGLGGLAAAGLGLGGVAQLAFALVCGLLVGTFAAVALRLARRHGNLGTHSAALEGRVAQVLVAPAANRPGKVELTIEGQLQQRLVRSEDVLRPGDQVIVVGDQGGLLDVRAWSGT